MPDPRIDVVVLTMNDRPSEEAAAQETLLAQVGVDVRVCVVGNGCEPDVVPPGALTVRLPENVGIPGGRNAGAEASPEESDGACYTDAPGLSDRARTNRATLGRALSSAGLINYRTEWWHWSFGDRYWALRTRQPAALYGPVDMSQQHRVSGR